MSTLITEARNASLEEMVEILRDQRSRRLDLIVPAADMSFRDGQLVLKGAEIVERYEDLGDGQKVLMEQFDPNGAYLPTTIFDEHLAERLDIPLRYVRRMRTERPDLYDRNANGWLRGRNPKARLATDAEIEELGTVENNQLIFDEDNKSWWIEERPGTAPISKKYTIRLYRGDDGELGVARAWLSNRFAPFDNFDGLMALMEGIKSAGMDPSTISFDRLDLTERRMNVSLSAPEITALAPELLKGYRDPFAGDGPQRAAALVRGRDIDEWREVARREGLHYENPSDEPIVSAGLDFDNSEVGGGSYRLTPKVMVQICRNGLKINAMAHAERHIGKALDEGVRWGHDTQVANLDLVVMQTRDLVSQWLDKDFLQARVDELEEQAGAEVKKPTEAIKEISKRCGFSDEHAEGILNFFVRGGQMTAGGVANAITAYSQTVVNPEVAAALDDKAVEAMALAARG